MSSNPFIVLEEIKNLVMVEKDKTITKTFHKNKIYQISDLGDMAKQIYKTLIQDKKIKPINFDRDSQKIKITKIISY